MLAYLILKVSLLCYFYTALAAMSQSHPNSNCVITQTKLRHSNCPSMDLNHFNGNDYTYDGPPTKTRAITFAPRRANSNCSNLPDDIRQKVPRRQDSLPHTKQYELIMVDVGPISNVNNSTTTNNTDTHQKSNSDFLSSSPKRPYPSTLELPLLNNGTNKPTDFGRSLLAGVCTAYSAHFVLSGIDKRYANMEQTLSAIYEDVKHPRGGLCSNSLSSLLSPTSSQSNTISPYLTPPVTSQQTSSLNKLETQKSTDTSCGNNYMNLANKNEESLQAVVVAADCSNYDVKIISSKNCLVEETQITSPSEAVASMLEQFVDLYRQGCNSTFLISFLEDRLGSILSKSNVLVRLVSSADDQLFSNKSSAENLSPDLIKPVKQHEPSTSTVIFNEPSNDAYEKNDSQNYPKEMSCLNLNTSYGNKNEEIISMEHVSSILGCHCSDLRLILNVASVYSPIILSSAI